MRKKIIITFLIILFAFGVSGCQMLDNLFSDKKEFKISFYSDNRLISEENLTKGSLLTAPEVNKEGFELLGWYKDLDDENSVWDFTQDTINDNTRLDAKWSLKEEFIFISNVRLENNLLYYDVEKGAEVIINFLDQEITSNTDYIDLLPYKDILDKEVEFTLVAIKEGYTAVANKVKINYLASELYESEIIDFEAFAYSDFKELNRQSYKTSEINDDDFYLAVKEARLTNVSETFIVGEVSLILRKEGEIELKKGYKAFEKLTFNLASYQHRSTTSTIEVMASNDQATWFNVGEYSISEYIAGNNLFDSITVVKTDLPAEINLTNNVYFKLIAKISKENIIVDDIIVYELTQPSFNLVQVVEDKFELSDYYLTAKDLTGKELIEQLRVIISTNLNPIRYKDIKEILEFADAKLDDSSKVIGIYDRQLYRANWGSSSEWHREHVWPNSRLGMDRVKENEVNQASDPHNLRAIQPSVNSSRSNRYYDQKVDSELIIGHTLTKGVYYPGDKDKGDVARILLYMIIRYEFLGLTDQLVLLERPAYTPEAAYMGLLKNLLVWHIEDPVDDFEINRNEVIYNYQNNRNPFIDHPELFELVFNYLVGLDFNRKIHITNDIVVYLEEDRFKFSF